ncbi:TIGR04086 family membrane protein [Salibacterium salarium]|uniref:TIGR04086 family membrane protein n=1 Tax=Salibacterium salarium TaxID=284579 RepID=A0A3R9P398_9BACI|nr:TIGR04086 family membrane protein [Salibacterium salarium]RSL29250.1 TIGR04086 family membrane protein [Salibacterium salarium]
MQRTGQLYGIGIGMVVIISILLACSIIFSTLLRFTSISEGSIQWLLLLVTIISFGVGGIIAGVRAKEKGILTGLFTAAGVLLVFALFEYLGYDSSISGIQALYFSGFVASSAIGGAIGVNTSS